MTAEVAADFSALGAETVTYTPDGGNATAISAVVEREEVRLEPVADGTRQVRRAILRIKTADATPGLRDKMTFDSLTWVVTAIRGTAAGVATVEVESTAADRKARPGAYGA